MTQLETEVQEYFSSLSCMSRTFVAIENYLQESYGEKWDELTEEEKEMIFDDCVIPDSIADVYKNSHPENLPEVFPKLKVPCGEKIIVEESGRTWVDEHSGPFSWANRSQQDLRLFGTEDEIQEKKPVRPPRRHRTSDNKEEKSQGNSLGKPLGNPQPEMTAADEIFQKFGIQFGTDQDDEEEDEVEDSSGPLLPNANSDSKTESSYVNTEMLPKSEIDHMTSQLGHVALTGQSKGEADFLGEETYVMPELDSKPEETNDDTTIFGVTTTESTTDYDPNFGVESSEVKCEVDDNQVIDVQPISVPYPEFLEAEEQDKDLISGDAKTGFDFLDNW